LKSKEQKKKRTKKEEEEEEESRRGRKKESPSIGLHFILSVFYRKQPPYFILCIKRSQGA
jgi:hypothetical protein